MGTFPVTKQTTVGEFKKLFAAKFPKYYVSRQWFTVDNAKGVALKNEAETLVSYATASELTLVFKDLGAQISWRTVFLVEYFGPLFIHPLFYFLPHLMYPGLDEQTANTPKHLIQQVALVCVLLHYVKREYETIFVHRFSNDTMPWFNIIKNSTHYWFISGVMIAYFVYHPLFTPASWIEANPMLLWVFVGLFLVSEFNNYICHTILRDLRKPGTKERGIPQGNLFSLVSCANYTWELLAWLAFSIFTQTLTSYIFFLVSFGQIYLWALKKHKQYRNEFNGKDGKPAYPRRKALIPFLV